MEPCTFRLYKKGGRCCGSMCACAHGRSGAVHQAVLLRMLEQAREWVWDDAFTYFERALDARGEVRRERIVNAMNYIFNRCEVSERARELQWAKKNKIHPTVVVCAFYERLVALSKKPAFIVALIVLQKRFREKNVRVYVNTEDPFTLEPIAPEHLFGYKASDGRMYAFSAPELFHYISSHEPLNPYTRERIPDEAISRLKKMMTKIPRRPIPVWRNPRDAFVDVLHAYECFGFYTRLEWFTNAPLQAIYHVYERMSHDRHVPAYLFTMDALDASIAEDGFDGPYYSLATSMRTMIQHSFATQFYSICKLFLALADVNPEMRGAIPQWLIAGGT